MSDTLDTSGLYLLSKYIALNIEKPSKIRINTKEIEAPNRVLYESSPLYVSCMVYPNQSRLLKLSFIL